jgi:magnesium chelatase family protein
MHAQIPTIAFQGIETIAVTIQIHIANGLPAMAIVGLALPPKRIVANLAPADVLKEKVHFDLPVALGLMVAMGVVPRDAFAQALAYRVMPLLA